MLNVGKSSCSYMEIVLMRTDRVLKRDKARSVSNFHFNYVRNATL